MMLVPKMDCSKMTLPDSTFWYGTRLVGSICRVKSFGDAVDQDVPRGVQSSVDFDQSKLSTFVN